MRGCGERGACLPGVPTRGLRLRVAASARRRGKGEGGTSRILRELATWDIEKLRPLAPALKPVLAEQRGSGWAQAVLKKLGD